MHVWALAAIIPVALLGFTFFAAKGGARRRPRTSDVGPGTDVDYKTRHDLIPDLGEALKVYSFHQSES